MNEGEVRTQLSEDVEGRLSNWKFTSALHYLERSNDTSVTTDSDRETIKALAAMFGNCGWPDDGAMNVIVWAAIQSLGVYE